MLPQQILCMVSFDVAPIIYYIWSTLSITLTDISFPQIQRTLSPYHQATQ